MILIALFLQTIGFVEKTKRGDLVPASILLFNFMGFVSGYFSTRIYKNLEVRILSILL